MQIRLLSFFVILSFAANAQLTVAGEELKAYSRTKNLFPDDTSAYLENFHQNGFHYFKPLYKAYRLQDKLLKADTALYYDMLSQALAFTSDYFSALSTEKKGYESLDDSSKADVKTMIAAAVNIQYTDAKKYILQQAKTNSVVMINEAHNKPLHRAFTASLLEDLYRQGFRYLAMEMLDHHFPVSVVRPSVFSGYYVAEPVAAELLRKAVDLGYTLISYEDTVPSHTTTKEREYAQAENLWSAIRKLEPGAKVLVHAGYAHIQEAAKPDTRIPIPMAAYFKILSGINPLTIDQTEMTEGGKDAFTEAVYTQWLSAHPFTTPMIAIKDNQPYDPFQLQFYDLHVLHPVTHYQNERPVWLSMNGWKQETQVAPAFRNTFFVQAYYEKEYDEKKLMQSVPADQTYNNAANGLYYLYLRKGKYKLVFRDKAYNLLGTKDITVD